MKDFLIAAVKVWAIGCGVAMVFVAVYLIIRVRYIWKDEDRKHDEEKKAMADEYQRRIDAVRNMEPLEQYLKHKS